jgi:hypothetical protein
MTTDEIVARVDAAATAAADGPVLVRVGDDVHGYRNLGVDLLRCRRSAAESRLLRSRVWAALEAAGVVMAQAAVAPKVGGDFRGHVQVREPSVSWSDAAHLAGPPRSVR